MPSQNLSSAERDRLTEIYQSSRIRDLFPAETERLIKISPNPRVRLAVFEVFESTFNKKKKAIDKILNLHFFKSEEEYREVISETVRDCVDAVYKDFEKFAVTR